MQQQVNDGWYLARGGTTYGPYSWDGLAGFVAGGRLIPTDLVWHPTLARWTPAGRIPGLLPATGRRTSAGFMARLGRPAKAAICIAAVVVLSVICVGIWLGVRGGEGSAADSAAQASGEEIKTEELKLSGTVVLPPGTSLAPEDLVVLSNMAQASCSDDGGFKTEALHDQGARTPVAVMNKQGRPMLLAMADSDSSKLQPSVASTARVLVLFDPAFLGLPQVSWAHAVEQLEAHPRLPALEAALAANLASDPAAPLDPDSHPDLYVLAAEIAADLLGDIFVIDDGAFSTQSGPGWPMVTAGSGPPTLLAAADGGPRQLALLAATPDMFVFVEDDPAQGDPVNLVNTTFGTYTVDWTRRTADGENSGGTTLLQRYELWRYIPDAFRLGIPPKGARVTNLLEVGGDGDLEFEFRKNRPAMYLSISCDLVTQMLGVGGEMFRSRGTDPDKLTAALKALGTGVQVFDDLDVLAGRLQGMPYSAMAKEVGGFVAANGVKLYLAVKPLIIEDVGNVAFGKWGVRLLQEFGVMVTKKMVALATLGYGSLELVGQIWALGNSNYDEYITEGRQMLGIYPFDASLKLIAARDSEKSWVFEVDYEVPFQARNKVELYVDYGDGRTETFALESLNPNVMAPDFAHTYTGGPPEKVTAVLRSKGSPKTIVASAEDSIAADKEIDLAGVWTGSWTQPSSGEAHPLTVTLTFDQGYWRAQWEPGGPTYGFFYDSAIGIEFQIPEAPAIHFSGVLTDANTMNGTLYSEVWPDQKVPWTLKRQQK